MDCQLFGIYVYGPPPVMSKANLRELFLGFFEFYVPNKVLERFSITDSSFC